jgi:hypothetical protein
VVEKGLVCFMFTFLTEHVKRNTSKPQNARGATLLEFAVISAFLFFFLIIAAEFLFMCYTSVTMQFIATRALRQSILGPPAGQPPAATYAEAIENGIIANGHELFVSLDRDHIYICLADPNNINIKCATDNAGVGDDLISVYIEKRFSIPFFGFLGYTLDALAVGKNEPF